jgi:hypothetical protein
MTQASYTVPIIPLGFGNVKNEITTEHRVAESNKQDAQRVVSRERAKEKKAAEERAKQAELLQIVHAKSNADALAKQAALHAVAILKGEVVNQFTVD